MDKESGGYKSPLIHMFKKLKVNKSKEVKYGTVSCQTETTNKFIDTHTKKVLDKNSQLENHNNYNEKCKTGFSRMFEGK